MVVLVRIMGVPRSMSGAPIKYCGTPMTEFRITASGRTSSCQLIIVTLSDIRIIVKLATSA